MIMNLVMQQQTAEVMMWNAVPTWLAARLVEDLDALCSIIIIKVFVKRKVLSIETILSA